MGVRDVLRGLGAAASTAGAGMVRLQQEDQRKKERREELNLTGRQVTVQEDAQKLDKQIRTRMIELQELSVRNTSAQNKISNEFRLEELKKDYRLAATDVRMTSIKLMIEANRDTANKEFELAMLGKRIEGEKDVVKMQADFQTEAAKKRYFNSLMLQAVNNGMELRGHWIKALISEGVLPLSKDPTKRAEELLERDRIRGEVIKEVKASFEQVQSLGGEGATDPGVRAGQGGQVGVTERSVRSDVGSLAGPLDPDQLLLLSPEQREGQISHALLMGRMTMEEASKLREVLKQSRSRVPLKLGPQSTGLSL